MEKYGEIFVKKIIHFIACVLACVLSLTACGANRIDAYKETTIEIKQTGGVNQIIVEDFSSDAYDVTELTSFIDAEIAEYNVANSEDAIVSSDVSFDDEEKIARISIDYESYVDYEKLNSVTLFYGTVADAENEGYEMPETLTDSEGASISESALSGLSDMTVIIASENLMIKTPKRIAYVSEGVIISSGSEADTTEAEGELFYIVLAD